MRGNGFRSFKLMLRRHVDNTVPGFLGVLDSLSTASYGYRFLDLFFTSPCKAYGVVREYYGDESTADFTMLRLFLRPLAVALNDIMLEDKLLGFMKLCRDSDFLNAVAGRGVVQRVPRMLVQ